MMVFGGKDIRGDLLSDIWEHDGQQWFGNPSVLGPPARYRLGGVISFAEGLVSGVCETINVDGRSPRIQERQGFFPRA